MVITSDSAGLLREPFKSSAAGSLSSLVSSLPFESIGGGGGGELVVVVDGGRVAAVTGGLGAFGTTKGLDKRLRLNRLANGLAPASKRRRAKLSRRLPGELAPPRSRGGCRPVVPFA